MTNTEAPPSSAPSCSADCLTCHGPCSAGHVPLCFEDQEIRQKFFQNLHKADKLTHSSRLTKAWSRDILRSWTRDLRIGTIYYEPSHLGKSSCAKEDAEVWCLDDATFKRYTDEGVVFLVPVVVKERFKDSEDYSRARYAEDLSDALGPRSLKVRTFTTSGNIISMHSKQLVQRLLRPLASQLPINALDLTPWAKAEKPHLTSLPRFRLLDRLVDRRRAVGKQTDLMPFDVGGCLLFDLLGFPGAFSGAHLDSLVGTWLRTLFGSKFWMIVPQKKGVKLALSLLATLGVASAHSIMQEIAVNGKAYGQGVGIYMPSDDSFQSDASSESMACNGAPVGYFTSSSEVISVNAGDTVTGSWLHTLSSTGADSAADNKVIDSSHKGPVMAYMKKVADATQNPSAGPGDGWFKISEAGLISSTEWAMDALINAGGVQTVTIPSCIEDGNYLLRFELIALHSASVEGDAQFYIRTPRLLFDHCHC
ncbi:hypothetical protein LTR49_022139 [Elasticomyces elasticus]|nr:hypothetical protein LTR49_022139 [Elasticomyces elasticus]